MPPADQSLDSLRREIDSIDEAMHDLLMKRARLGDRLRQAKGAGATIIYRPGREATILRRLLDRHDGPLPRRVVVRVWREIIAALTGLQGPLCGAVYAPQPGGRCAELARDHFGVLTPLQPFPKTGPVVAAVRDGAVTVGILPLGEDGPAEPWWRHLGGEGANALHILAGLPFLPDDKPGRAVIVGRQPFEPTGEDRGFLLIEADREISRTAIKTLIEQAGVGVLGLRGAGYEEDGRSGRRFLYCIEVDRFVAAGDPVLAALAMRAATGKVLARPIGGYAVPPALPASVDVPARAVPLAVPSRK